MRQRYKKLTGLTVDHSYRNGTTNNTDWTMLSKTSLNKAFLNC